MSNKTNSNVIMNDQQYYNGGYSSKTNTLNKSTLAAMSRENLHQAPPTHRRMEPKHLQQAPPRMINRHNQPDLIKDFNGAPNGTHPEYHPDFQHQLPDSLRRSQGTNTKHPQREFQIYPSSQNTNGRHEEIYQNLPIQSKDPVMTKHKSFNGVSMNESYKTPEAERRLSQTIRPHSRGASANSSAIELINMNYNSIQKQMERNLQPTSVPQSRTKMENGQQVSPPRNQENSTGRKTPHDLSQSLPKEEATRSQSRMSQAEMVRNTGRKTPHDLSKTLPKDEATRNHKRMSQAEIVQNRNMTASRQTPVEPPNFRNTWSEESHRSQGSYQHFTEDKVSPIAPVPKKRSGEPFNPNQERMQSETPVPRNKIPPHERKARLTKESLDQLRKPRGEVEQKNVPPHLNPAVRQQPMGAEAVKRPATSMGFAVKSTGPKFPNSSTEAERQTNVRQRLEHLQRRKSGGPGFEVSLQDFSFKNESPQLRTDSTNNRPPSGSSRRKSYTTSTPAKSEDRVDYRAVEKLRVVDGRASRNSSDSSSSRDLPPSKLVKSSAESGANKGPSFQDRSAARWHEINCLSQSVPHEVRNKRDIKSGSDYPFFLDFSKSTPEVTSSLDSLNQEVSHHLSASETQKLNGEINRNKPLRTMTSNFQSESDLQTPQLSSPVDFDPTNPDGSSNEDLDLEVRQLLGQPENNVDTIDMALYQKMISETIHGKITSLRDRRFTLEQKENDLHYKRERLQQRMHQALAKTSAMLNKSIEHEKSRVHVNRDMFDTSRAGELATIQALSTTVRPKTPSSGNKGRSSRPQNTTDSRPVRKHDVRQDYPVYNTAHQSTFSQREKEEYV